MESLLQRIWAIVLSAILAWLAALSGGCAIFPTNAGEIGFRTSWALYHEARESKEGKDVKASLELKAPALVEWWTGTDEPASEEME